MVLKFALVLVFLVGVLQAATLQKLERTKRAFATQTDWYNTVTDDNTGDANTCSDLDHLSVNNEFEIKDILLGQHNDIRQEYNTERAACDEPGEALADLEWDSDLAKLAQLWANMCTWGHGYTSTECDCGAAIQYGQNVYYSTTRYTYSKGHMQKKVVDTWRDVEKPITDVCTHACSPTQMVPTCGHYLQLVSDSTTKVGCAYTDPAHKCTKAYYQDDAVDGKLDTTMDTLDPNWPDFWAMYVCVYDKE